MLAPPMPKRHSQSSRHSSKQIVKTKEIKRGLSEVKAEIANLTHKNDPNQVLKEAEKKMLSLDYDSYESNGDDPIFKAMTLREFDNGTLLTSIMPGMFSTFAIDLMRKIQQEYACIAASEKAMAELAAVSFVRSLDAQRRIKNYLDIGEFTAVGVQYMAVMSKELDRANRHYLTAIQTLRMLRQPPMQVNIKTNTAVVGQNQIIQANSNNEPK